MPIRLILAKVIRYILWCACIPWISTPVKREGKNMKGGDSEQPVFSWPLFQNHLLFYDTLISDDTIFVWFQNPFQLSDINIKTPNWGSWKTEEHTHKRQDSIYNKKFNTPIQTMFPQNQGVIKSRFPRISTNIIKSGCRILVSRDCIIKHEIKTGVSRHLHCYSGKRT